MQTETAIVVLRLPCWGKKTFPKAGKGIRMENWHAQKIAPIFLIFAKVGTIKFRYLTSVSETSLVLKCIKSVADK